MAGLEPLQQTVEIIELIARAIVLARAPAQFVQDFTRALQIGLVRYLDVSGIHLARARQGAAERILGLAELIEPVGVWTARLAAKAFDQLLHHVGLALLQILQRPGLRLDRTTREALAQGILGPAHFAAGLVELLR